MSSHLSNLVRIQQLDLKITELRDHTEQIPRQIESLNLDFESQRESVDKLREQIEAGGKLTRDLEGEIEILGETLAKYKSQLTEVKTNKEYQAMLHEIDNTNQAIGKKEDKILSQMISLDEWEMKSRDADLALSESQKEVSKSCSDLEKLSSQLQKDIETYAQERTQIFKKIPNRLAEHYEKIALVRNGVALAEARDQSCQSCHVKLRPQLFNEIKTHQQIITCESCNRILYYSGT